MSATQHTGGLFVFAGQTASASNSNRSCSEQISERTAAPARLHMKGLSEKNSRKAGASKMSMEDLQASEQSGRSGR